MPGVAGDPGRGNGSGYEGSDVKYPIEPDDWEDLAALTDKRCPRCEAPVVQQTTLGPATHVMAPCGCRVGGVDW